MLASISMLVPPLVMLLLWSRLEKRPGRAILWTVTAYCACVLLTNLLTMAATCLLTGQILDFWVNMQRKAFAVKYASLSLAISLALPWAAAFLRRRWPWLDRQLNALRAPEALLLLMSLAFFVFHGLRCFDNIFWSDEGYTIRLVKMSIPQMLQTTQGDVHPPLFYLFTQLLYWLLGDHGYTYHFSAFIPYVGILVLACTRIRKRYGTLAACVLVLLASGMRQTFLYIVEARMYQLAAFFCLAAFLELDDLLGKGGRKHWIFFSLYSLGAAYCHYYALITVAFFYAALLLVSFRRKELVRPVLLTCGVAIAGYLPWLATLLTTFARSAGSWWSTEIPTLEDSLLFAMDTPWLILLFVGILAAAAFQAVPSPRRTGAPQPSQPESADQSRPSASPAPHTGAPGADCQGIWLLTGVAAFAGTIAVGLLVSWWIRPLFLERYIYPAAVVLYLVIGICISRLPLRRWLAAAVCAAVMVSNAPATLGRYYSDQWIETQSQALLAAFQVGPNSVIHTNERGMFWNLLCYYLPGVPTDLYDDPMLAVTTGSEDTWLLWQQPLSEQTLEQIRQAGYTITFRAEGLCPNDVYCYLYQVNPAP